MLPAERVSLLLAGKAMFLGRLTTEEIQGVRSCNHIVSIVDRPRFPIVADRSPSFPTTAREFSQIRAYYW